MFRASELRLHGNAVLTIKRLGLPLNPSSSRLRSCDVFLLKALPPEKNTAPARPSKARAATGIFPDRKVRCCGCRGRILDFFSTNFLPQLCRRDNFPFQSLPVLRGFLDLPLKSSSRQAASRCGDSLCRSLPPPQPSEEIKTKREGNP